MTMPRAMATIDSRESEFLEFTLRYLQRSLVLVVSEKLQKHIYAQVRGVCAGLNILQEVCQASAGRTSCRRHTPKASVQEGRTVG